MSPSSIALLFLGYSLTACSSTKQMVPFPDQSKRISDTAKGRIYVMRPNPIFGAPMPITVSDEQGFVGQTGPRGYLCWERAPGNARIESRSWEGVSELNLGVKPGNVYYVFQHIRVGVMAYRSELELVTENEGKKILNSCRPPENKNKTNQ